MHYVLLTVSFAVWLAACLSLNRLATKYVASLGEVALVLCWVVTAFDEADGSCRCTDILVVSGHGVGLDGHLLLLLCKQLLLMGD